MMKIKNAVALLASAAALVTIAGAADAHLTTFGYIDNGNGTVTFYGEHWHGDLSSPYTANGGLHITDTTTLASVTLQWTSVINNVTIPDMHFTGYADTMTGISGAYNDWMVTQAYAIGDGTYDFYTGPNCCVDEMDDGPVRLTLTGITSVPPGIGGVPEPATWAMMIMGAGMTGYSMRRRRVTMAAAA